MLLYCSPDSRNRKNGTPESIIKHVLRKLISKAIRAILILFFLALIPALFRTLTALPINLDEKTAGIPLLCGLGSGLILFGFIHRFTSFYVLGHELTHWVSAKLFFKKTGLLSVGDSGGSVQVERPNAFISLSPYFIPFYCIVWLGIYGVYNLFVKTPPPLAVQLSYAGLGIGYAYHLALTFVALKRGQSDLLQHGKIFSMIFIIAANILLLLLLATAFSGRWSDATDLLIKNITNEWETLLRLFTKIRKSIIP